LYAFCRVADDAIDNSDDRPRALADLHQRLDAVYADAPRPVVADRALAYVVRHVGIPRLLLDALLEGFAWDAAGRRYDTLEEVYDYGARVAGTVGAMMALVMQTRSASALARACELGVAMQLTNIARDVGEDARAGRLYLPRQWLHEAGVDADAWLRNPVFGPGVADVVQRLLQAADGLYRRAERGVAELPRDCRPAIQAARLVYAEIGREVEAAGFDSITRRAVVRPQRKLALIARACSSAVLSPGGAAGPLTPLPAIAYLVGAASSHELPQRTFYDRTVRVIDMFERLNHRQRNGLSFGAAGDSPWTSAG
jgi:phytoene synthase